MVSKIVTFFIPSDDEEDKITNQVEQGILRPIVQTHVCNTLQLVIDTVSYPILGTGLREDVERGQRAVTVCIILLKK
jgi:hypothetical protein